MGYAYPMKLMRTLLFWAGLVALGSVAAAQQPGYDPAIDATIQRQMDAFLADDLDAAFAIASPAIQRIFGTAENFGLMVSQGYPMVRRPADVKYLEQRQQSDAVMQLVQVTGPDGANHWFAYEMVVVDGDWRINGVYRVEAPAPSV